MKSLLLGCGNNREKRLYYESKPDWAGDLVTIDMNPDCGADVVWNLEQRPLPFGDEEFDELGAFDVLEHIGRQGDWKGFFEEFAEYWRILKPGGLFFIVVPIGPDYHADPGHTRFFGPTWFMFLSRDWYRIQLEEKRPVTDYRWFWKRDFKTLSLDTIGNHHLSAILRKQ